MSRRGVRDNRCPVAVADPAERRRSAAETAERPDVMRARFARANAARPYGSTRKPRSTQKRRAIFDQRNG